MGRDRVTTAPPGSVGLRSEHPGITRSMRLPMSWDPWPRPVATLALSLAAQARASGTPSPAGPGMPSRFRPASRDSRANAGVRQRLRPREPASADPCPPVRSSGLSDSGSPGPLTTLASPAGRSRRSACRTPDASAPPRGPRRDDRGASLDPRPPRSLSGPAQGFLGHAVWHGASSSVVVLPLVEKTGPRERWCR